MSAYSERKVEGVVVRKVCEDMRRRDATEAARRRQAEVVTSIAAARSAPSPIS